MIQTLRSHYTDSIYGVTWAVMQNGLHNNITISVTAVMEITLQVLRNQNQMNIYSDWLVQASLFCVCQVL